MPEDPRPDLVLKAICAGVRGQIEWHPKTLALFRDDPEMAGFTEIGVKEAVHAFVMRHGGCKVQKETDPYWLSRCPDDPWWYYVVVPVSRFPKGLFVKMKLIWEEGDDEEDAFVQIISIHEEK